MSGESLSGPGTQTIQLSDKDGMVIMHFEKPVEWVALDPATAVRVAEAMARASYNAKFGDVPTTQQRSSITEQIRIRLRNRVKLMLASMATDAPAPSYDMQATRIVDAVLKEVA